MFERGKKDDTNKGRPDTPRSGNQQDSNTWKSESTSQSKASGHSEMAVIGRSIRIDGDLCGEEDLRIEGDVNGTVQLRNNTLTIGSEGKISANVYAKSVTVDGLMEGDIYGSERVTVRKNAQVNGNITAPRVSLEDGAKFKGSIEMDPAAVEKALGQKAAAAKSSATMGAATKATSQANGETRMDKPAPAPHKGGARTGSLS